MTGSATRARETVVVTGASGFVGRALVRALAARGSDVLAVSRRAIAAPGAAWVRIADYGETPCPAGATLVHLAEEATIPLAVARGEAHVAAVQATVAALAAKGFRRMVYSSSGQVYRAAADATDPYIRAKHAAEAIVLAAGGAVVRLANVYGPGMRNRTLIGDIMRQIPGQGPLVIRSAAPRRDFLWIEDAADGLAAIALGSAAGVFDLGSGEIVSAAEMARLALAAAGEADRPVVAEIADEAADDVVALDIGAVRECFGWRPRVGIGEGLARLVRSAA